MTPRKPTDTAKWKQPTNKALTERRELLMAHINTLDMVIGEDYRKMVESGSSLFREAVQGTRLSLSIDAPSKLHRLIVADIYRDFLEAELKGLHSGE